MRDVRTVRTVLQNCPGRLLGLDGGRGEIHRTPPVSVLHGKHLFNSRDSKAPSQASGSVGGQVTDTTLSQFELEAEDSQNFFSGQPPLPRRARRICQNNFTQAILVFGIGVGDIGFCLLEFRLAELDDRAKAQVVT